MEQEEWKTLYGTLERVEQSLNQRFEKNAALYISIENVEKIKENLHLGEFDKIEGMYVAKKYSSEILTSVIVNNAWLIHAEKMGCLNKIFNECSLAYLKNLMENKIFTHEVDIPKHLRKSMIAVYLKRLDDDECERLLESYESENVDYSFLADPYFKAICIKNILSDMEPMDKYEGFNEYAEYYQDILGEIKVMRDLFTEEDFTDDVCEAIFTEQFLTDDSLTTTYWRNQLVSKRGADDLFGRMNAVLENHHVGNIQQAKNLIKNIYPLVTDDNYKEFLSCFVHACVANSNNVYVNQVVDSLAKRIHNKSNWNEAFIHSLKVNNIQLPREEDDIDIDEIVEQLDVDYHITHKKTAWLRIVFLKRYGKAKKFNQYIRYVCDHLTCSNGADNFYGFCCLLVEYGNNDYKYLKYVLDNDCFNDSGVVERILQYIETKDLLREKNLDKSIRREIMDFVKENDFALFRQLTE